MNYIYWNPIDNGGTWSLVTLSDGSQTYLVGNGTLPFLPVSVNFRQDGNVTQIEYLTKDGERHEGPGYITNGGPGNRNFGKLHPDYGYVVGATETNGGWAYNFDARQFPTSPGYTVQEIIIDESVLLDAQSEHVLDADRPKLAIWSHVQDRRDLENEIRGVTYKTEGLDVYAYLTVYGPEVETFSDGGLYNALASLMPYGIEIREFGAELFIPDYYDKPAFPVEDTTGGWIARSDSAPESFTITSAVWGDANFNNKLGGFSLGKEYKVKPSGVQNRRVEFIDKVKIYDGATDTSFPLVALDRQKRQEVYYAEMQGSTYVSVLQRQDGVNSQGLAIGETFTDFDGNQDITFGKLKEFFIVKEEHFGVKEFYEYSLYQDGDSSKHNVFKRLMGYDLGHGVFGETFMLDGTSYPVENVRVYGNEIQADVNGQTISYDWLYNDNYGNLSRTTPQKFFNPATRSHGVMGEQKGPYFRGVLHPYNTMMDEENTGFGTFPAVFALAETCYGTCTAQDTITVRKIVNGQNEEFRSLTQEFETDQATVCVECLIDNLAPPKPPVPPLLQCLNGCKVQEFTQPIVDYELSTFTNTWLEVYGPWQWVCIECGDPQPSPKPEIPNPAILECIGGCKTEASVSAVVDYQLVNAEWKPVYGDAVICVECLELPQKPQPDPRPQHKCFVGCTKTETVEYVYDYTFDTQAWQWVPQKAQLEICIECEVPTEPRPEKPQVQEEPKGLECPGKCKTQEEKTWIADYEWGWDYNANKYSWLPIYSKKLVCVECSDCPPCDPCEILPNGLFDPYAGVEHFRKKSYTIEVEKIEDFKC